MNIGKEINNRFNHVTYHNVHKPTRELMFNSMLDVLRSPLRLIITIPVFNSIPNLIDNIRL
jgi:hypothetical protein